MQEVVTCHMIDPNWTLFESEAEQLCKRYSLGNLKHVMLEAGAWVKREREDTLVFHDADAVTKQLFKVARVPQPEIKAEEVPA